MGFPQNELVFMLMQHMPTCDPSLIARLTAHLHAEETDVFVVAPLSAWRLGDDSVTAYPPASDFSFTVSFDNPPARLAMSNLATFRRHVNLDDMDFGGDGVVNTLRRVVGRRGLGVWKVDRICDAGEDDGFVVIHEEQRSGADAVPTETSVPVSKDEL
jgi:phosphatidylinositol glycan class Z